MFRVRFFTEDRQTYTYEFPDAEEAVAAISDAFEVGLVVQTSNREIFYPSRSIVKATKKEVPVA